MASPTPAPSCVQVLNVKADPLWKEPCLPNLPHVPNETYRQRLITLNCPFPFTCLTQITHWVNRFFSPPPRLHFSPHPSEGHLLRDTREKLEWLCLWRILLLETFWHHCQAGGKKRGQNDCKGRDAFHTHFILNAKIYIFSKRRVYNFAFRPFRYCILWMFVW